ncbi:MAG: hypothetical protein R3Y54_01435 [Eubacteriales bacterium]
MKFKYQLRGFAVGVIITAMVMTAIQRDNGSNTAGEVGVQPSIETDDEEESEDSDEESSDEGSSDEESSDEESSNPTETSSNIENALTDFQVNREEVQSLLGSNDLLLINKNTEDESTVELGSMSILDFSNETIEEESTVQEILDESSSLTVEEVETEQAPIEGDNSTLTKHTVDINLSIVSGDSSYSVSQKLYDLGAIESVLDFDIYLCTNGYDKNIRVGTYDIPAFISYERLARIISSR